MSGLLWFSVSVVGSVLGLMLAAVIVYAAGRLFSAGWHVSKMKLLRSFNISIKQGE